MPFDQTHILTVLGSYRLGNGWEFGARFRNQLIATRPLRVGNRFVPLFGLFA